ncbi:MAG: chemotaxis protein CheW [Acidithiobacillus sp.]
MLGNQQTVIKPLGKLFDQVPGISAATILGNGDVAPILDIPALIHHHASAKHIH